MTTLVMVERDGVACIAADTLTSFGSRKRSANYVERPEKIIEVGNAYVGLVGWSAHQNVLESVFANGLDLPDIVCEQDLFEFSRKLHLRLKNYYFLNTSEDLDDPYESSQMLLFVLNEHGMFVLYSIRSVDRCHRFVAAGSGTPYALGAMFAAYEQGLPAEDVARLGVAAGAEFDKSSQMPITLHRVELKAAQEGPKPERLLKTA